LIINRYLSGIKKHTRIPLSTGFYCRVCPAGFSRSITLPEISLPGQFENKKKQGQTPCFTNSATEMIRRKISD
jgi:hypothetical protein